MAETLRLAGLVGASALESSAVVVGLVADCEAAERYNSSSGPTTAGACVDAGTVNDMLLRDAADVNNGGLGSQIAYLVVALGRSQTKAELRTLGVRTN